SAGGISSGGATMGPTSEGGGSGSATDASGSPPSGGSADATASRATDASPAARDASGEGSLPVGDAGLPPYKGVANSACGDLGRLGVTWFYNWKLSPDNNCMVSQFVPMIWGHTGNEQSASGIASEINGIVSAGYRIVLGFNEPDN